MMAMPHALCVYHLLHGIGNGDRNWLTVMIRIELAASTCCCGYTGSEHVYHSTYMYHVKMDRASYTGVMSSVWRSKECSAKSTLSRGRIATKRHFIVIQPIEY